MGSGEVTSSDDEDEDLAPDERQSLRDARQKSREAKRRYKEKQIMHEKSNWLKGQLTDITRMYTKGTYGIKEESPNTFSQVFSSFLSDPRERVVDPGGITRHVNKLSPCLRPYQQEDAHEFLRSLLSTLTLDGQNKQLSSLFDGLLESAVTCQTCHRASVTRDRYMDLSLDITDSCVKDLEGALAKFTKTELLDGDNRVNCSRCKAKKVVSKGLRLATAPSILVCHLKRFDFDLLGRTRRIAKKINYPQRLEIGDFMSRANQSSPPPYELVGVLVHAGRQCESGHYLSFIKNGESWYKANDEVVTKVSVDIVLRQQAYILIYEVEGMRKKHGYEGFCKYHQSNRNKNKTKSPERASDFFSEKSVASRNSFSSTPPNDVDSDASSMGEKADTFLDSIISFCGAMSAAEAVRDAICDSERKQKNKKSDKSDEEDSTSSSSSLHEDNPLTPTLSMDSRFSRASQLSHLSKQSRKKVRSSSDSESKDMEELRQRVYVSKSKEVFRCKGPGIEGDHTTLMNDSQLIKSASSNNLLEKEEEAAVGYESERFARDYWHSPFPTKKNSILDNDVIEENRSDSGIIPRTPARKWSSAPRSRYRSTSVARQDDNLPPLPKRPQS
jgi:ubiquitin carboxyl-terminal hydrolase 36/42